MFNYLWDKWFLQNEINSIEAEVQVNESLVELKAVVQPLHLGVPHLQQGDVRVEGDGDHLQLTGGQTFHLQSVQQQN